MSKIRHLGHESNRTGEPVGEASDTAGLPNRLPTPPVMPGRTPGTDRYHSLSPGNACRLPHIPGAISLEQGKRKPMLLSRHHSKLLEHAQHIRIHPSLDHLASPMRLIVMPVTLISLPVGGMPWSGTHTTPVWRIDGSHLFLCGFLLEWIRLSVFLDMQAGAMPPREVSCTAPPRPARLPGLPPAGGAACPRASPRRWHSGP